MGAAPKVSVVIVSFNTHDVLSQCLQALKELDLPFGMEVLVIDNRSTDGSLQMLRSFGDWPGLRVVLNSENVGCAGARNQSLQLAKGEYVLFLDPDTICRPGAISSMAAYLDAHPDAGVVGPKLVHADGSLQLSCGADPRRWLLLWATLWHVLPTELTRRLLVRWRYRRWAPRGPRDVGWVLGACLMIRTPLAVKLGGFDENFFFSANDAIDLCTRVLEDGLRVVYCPNAEIVHKAGQSHTKADPRAKASYLLQSHRGDLYYCRKHRGPVAASLMRSMFVLACAVKLVIAGACGAVLGSQRYRTIYQARLITFRSLLARESQRGDVLG